MSRRKKKGPHLPELDALADAFMTKGSEAVAAASSAATIARINAMVLSAMGSSESDAIKSSLDLCRLLAELIQSGALEVVFDDGSPWINGQQFRDYLFTVRQ